MERWTIQDHIVEIRRRAYQRTLRMRVTREGLLQVSCASGVSRQEIVAFVKENEKFIRAQITHWDEVAQKFPPKRFVAGEAFPFLGRDRILTFQPALRPKVFIKDRGLVVSGPVTNCSEAIRKFYRQCGREYLSHRIAFFSKCMGVSPTDVSFRSQSSRWGSCSSRGHISLNWRLMAAGAAVIDYVIVHELAHLRHHDHSPRFWKLVSEFSPQFKQLKRWLHENQHAFEFLSSEL